MAKDRQTDYDSLSRDFNTALLKAEPAFGLCIQCGSCSATCSAARFTDFSPRLLFLQIKRGTIDSIRKESAKCMICGKCQLVCPRGVNNRRVMFSIRKLLTLNEIK